MLLKQIIFIRRSMHRRFFFKKNLDVKLLVLLERTELTMNTTSYI